MGHTVTAGQVMIGAVATVLVYIAAGAVALWGVAHAVPTRQVLAGFEPINSAKPRVLL
jgi:citrate synthase